MIRITRQHPPPESLASEKTADAKEKILEIITRGEKPQSKDFDNRWNMPDIRKALSEMQHGKCCYCERKRDPTHESDIEHFRPKAKVTEADESHSGYWWLAYDWANLFLSCKTCNEKYKKNHFPLSDEHARAHGPDDDIASEDPLLIHPETDEPEACIGYDWASSDQRLAMPYGRDRAGKGAKQFAFSGWTVPSSILTGQHGSQSLRES